MTFRLKYGDDPKQVECSLAELHLANGVEAARSARLLEVGETRQIGAGLIAERMS